MASDSHFQTKLSQGENRISFYDLKVSKRSNGNWFTRAEMIDAWNNPENITLRKIIQSIANSYKIIYA